MFTGIIEEIGTVASVRNAGERYRLTVTAHKVLEDTRVGDSICTNGVCLTVADFDSISFTADVMPETLFATNLGKLHVGDRVNLERALPLGGRLGGHLVSGHVDGVATLIRRYRDGSALRLRFTVEPEILRLVVKKGSVTLDGISLTVTDVTEKDFGVSLVAHTQQETTLAQCSVGAGVNIENDIIGKYVQRLLVASESKEQELLDLLK